MVAKVVVAHARMSAKMHPFIEVVNEQKSRMLWLTHQFTSLPFIMGPHKLTMESLIWQPRREESRFRAAANKNRLVSVQNASTVSWVKF